MYVAVQRPEAIIHQREIGIQLLFGKGDENEVGRA